jgi:hypothetical protein
MPGRSYSPLGGAWPFFEALEPRLLLSGTVAPWASYEQPFWLQTPVRSQQDASAGLVGGEAQQWMQGMARSQSNPDIIYLAHDCGQVWRSDDNGQSWRPLPCHGLNVYGGESIEVDPVNPNVVYCTAGESSDWLLPNFQGLYRSTDGGNNWTLMLHPTVDPVMQRFFQHDIAFDPASVGLGGASRWYVAFAANSSGTGACLYRSDDGGNTWGSPTALTGIKSIYEIRTDLSDGNTLYLCTDQGLYVSLNRGATVTKVTALPTGIVTSFFINPQAPTNVYAVVRGTGLYRSTNGGSTYSLFYSYNADRAFMNPAFPNVMYVFPVSNSGGANMMVTTNGGTSWVKIAVTPPQGLGRDSEGSFTGDFSALLPDPRSANGAVAQAQATLWRTSDSVHWSWSSTLFTGFAADWWSDSIVFDRSNANKFTLFCDDVSMVFTTNAGQWFTEDAVPWSWYQQGLVSWIGTYSGDWQPVAGSQIVVASAGNYFSTVLIRSTDGGNTWTIVNNQNAYNLYVRFNPANPSQVFAQDLVSNDAGATWTVIPYLSGVSGQILGMCEAHPSTLYAVNSGDTTIYRSDDDGGTWRVYTTPGWKFTKLDPLPTFTCDPVNPNVIYTLDNKGDLARFDGTTWTSLHVLTLAGGSAQSNFIREMAIDARHTNILYAEVAAPGLDMIYRSTDGGTTWQDISYNLPEEGGGCLAVDPLTGDVMHGSCHGTWIFPPPYASTNSIFYSVGLRGDFNGDWKVNASDIDILTVALRNQSTQSRYDLGGDGQVGGADLDYLVRTILKSQYGDSNLNGKVDVTDQAVLYAGWGKSGGWAGGDFNGDGKVDAADLGLLKTYWHWQRSVGNGPSLSLEESGPALAATPLDDQGASQAPSVSAAAGPGWELSTSHAEHSAVVAVSTASPAGEADRPDGTLHVVLRRRGDSGFVELIASAAGKPDASASEGQEVGVAPPDLAVGQTTGDPLAADVLLRAADSIGWSPLLSALGSFGVETQYVGAGWLVFDLDPFGGPKGLAELLEVNV